VGLLIGFSSQCIAGELAYKPARLDNPLKGLIPGDYGPAKNFPHSLRYVQFPLAMLMTNEQQFTWSVLDKRLEAISAAGQQAVVRVYLDWPGRTNTIPNFLFESTRLVEGGWRSAERYPDYESSKLREALTNFIAAFGKRYDEHPDIAFIEAGLLGAWGEWLPVSRGAPTASAEVQQEILRAFEAAFHTTKILVRFPTAFSIERAFGYHDDWFGRIGEMKSRFEKIGVTNSLVWQREPMGARLHPEIQNCLNKPADACRLTAEQYNEVRSGHYTYLRMAPPIEPGPGLEDARKFAQTLGYELHVASADIATTADSLSVTISIRNTGVAPFYYRWAIELALARNGAIAQRWETDWDIRSVLPDIAPMRFESIAKNISVEPGEYVVLMRLRNPRRDAVFVSFANEAQDSSMSGWLTLGLARIGK
jgi:hypothetical protein